MITFVILATVMVVVTLAFVGLPLIRGSGRAGVERPAINLAIYRDQFAELEAERARGAISDAQYTENRAELERRVLEEGAASREPVAAGRSKAGLWTAIVLAGAVPVISALLYTQWGDPDAFSALGRATTSAATEAHGGLSPDEMGVAVDRLAERLKKEPENLDGWLTLARSYYSMGRFDQAAQAFDHVVKAVPGEADILADYADALAMAQGRNIAGKPMELVQAALKANPAQWKALAMAGTDAFSRQDYRAAVDYWERLQATQPAGSPIAEQLNSSIAEARQLGGIKSAPPKPGSTMPPMAAAPAPAPAAPRAGAAATVSGTVDLAPAVKAKAKPDDAVFIFARPADGSRMPVALTQGKVKDLPLKFTLDDTMAMSPDMVLSHQEKVIVGARLSKSGAPMPRPGDFEGLSTAVPVGAKNVAVTISRELP